MLNKQVTLTSLFLVLLLSRLSLAWQQPSGQTDLLGKPLPTMVSTPATGAWNAKHPFDPATFGKVRGYAPANQVTRLAIFSDRLDENVWKCLKDIDQILKDSDQQECYVTVFDIKGAQLGGYQVDELSERISELKKLTTERQIKRLSIGIAANSSPGNRAQVGLGAAGNVSIVLLTKADHNDKKAIVQSLIVLDSKKLDDKEVGSAMKLIQQHLQATMPEN